MTSTTKISALDFHNRLIAEKGVTEASGFSSEARLARFKIITRCLNSHAKTSLKVLDYGCGDGKYRAHLPFGMSYLGIDLNPKFIAAAKKCWPGNKFKVGDVRQQKTMNFIQRCQPDVIVASGVFCLNGEANTFKDTIRLLWFCANESLIFNVLDAECPAHFRRKTKGIVRWHTPDLLRLLRWCECSSWEIIHSYLPNDMTVVMRKNDWSPRP